MSASNRTAGEFKTHRQRLEDTSDDDLMFLILERGFIPRSRSRGNGVNQRQLLCRSPRWNRR